MKKNTRLFPILSFCIIFILLISLLTYGLFFASDPKKIPSVIVSQKAKPFQLTSLWGDPIQLENFAGKPIVLNFWASWCPPCKEEAVVLEEVYQLYKEHGAIFIGIAMSDNSDDSRKAAKTYGKSFFLANDFPGDKIAIDYGVTGVPETFFIGKDFTIKDKSIGVVKREQILKFLNSEL